jgi:CheY-like chemotaxis protein
MEISDGRILVVDDGITNRKLYHWLLSKGHFTVVTAMNAEEALEKLQTVHPCLILIDIQLGGMDGLELTRQLKANPATQSIPIIVMTAHREAYDEYHAQQAGAEGFMTLPIDVDAFVPIVRNVLKASRGTLPSF